MIFKTMSIDLKTSWIRVLLFYAIAFSISGLFNSGYLTPLYQKLTDGLIIKNWSFLPAGIGTLVAALFAFKYDKNLNHTITLFGNSNVKNIIISLVPVLVFTTIGLKNDIQINEHSYGLAFSFIALFYAITEEIFWRSYLLDILRSTNKFIYSLIIGTLWWAWHFRFDTSFDFTWFLLICIAGTFLLCQFANETKSYLASAGLHSLIILTTSNGEMTKLKTIGLGISIILWLLIGKFWEKGKIEGV